LIVYNLTFIYFLNGFYPKPISLFLFPRTHSGHVRFGDVFGTVIAGHCLSAAFICGIRGTGARQIFFGGLHHALGILDSLVHAVPIIAQIGVCFFCA
jgi:hypothetical protein